MKPTMLNVLESISILVLIALSRGQRPEAPIVEMWWSDQSSACFVLRFHSFGFVASCKNLGPHSFTKSSLHLTAGLPCVRFGPRGCHSKSARVHRVPLRDATREAHFHLLSLQYRTTSVRPVRSRNHSPVRWSSKVTASIFRSHFLCATASLFSSLRVRDQVSEA